MLRPYWPMSERLAITTRDLLSAHSRLYDANMYERVQLPQKSPDIDSITTVSTSDPLVVAPTFTPFALNNNSLVSSMPQVNNDIDFNSCEFLYDSALFGQIIFDNNNSKYLNDLMYQQQQQQQQ